MVNRRPTRITAILADYEGVVGPAIETLPVISNLVRNLNGYVSNVSGVPPEEVATHIKMLLKKHNTDTTSYALVMEYGVSVSEFSETVYGPELPAIRNAIGRDVELHGLMRSARVPIAVLSNNAEAYVRTASDAQGVTPLFVQFLCQESIHPYSKPNVGAYSTALGITKFTQDSHTVFLDDKPLNLVAPKELGLTTVYIGERAVQAGFVESIDFTFPTFKDFLRQLRRQDETTVMLT